MPVLRWIFAAVLLLTGAVPLSAQTYPNRPVRVVVGFPAGGPTDIIARIVAQNLSDSLGQQFYVENIPGAGSNTASGQVARTTPDGYTIMVTNLTWDSVKRLRDVVKGKLLLKGILAHEDAKLATEAGIDGIVVSNHGGARAASRSPG